MANNFGVGIDCGTMNIVAARKSGGDVETKRIRDIFLELPRESKKMLRLSGVSYVEREDELLILGDPALETANVFNKEPRRPLSAGLVSSSDIGAMEVLGLLIKNVLGAPKTEKEHCYFSVPAAPVDKPGQDIIYHKGVLNKIISEAGYRPTASNEAMAIVFSDAAKDGFSAISISCLIPGTRIYTGRGTIPIEDVVVGDNVITHKGRWKPVTGVVTKPFSGVSTDVQVSGYTNNTADYRFVDNHELYVKRGLEWGWVGCDDLVEGDIVGEPILGLETEFCCGTVQKVEHRCYDGIVYDLQVEDDHSFSGPMLTIHNCGSGMTNVAFAHNTVERLSFSVGRGGDFIDSGAAKSLGTTQARMCSIKEKGMNISSPTNREQEALSFYYKNLIEYTLEHFIQQFKAIGGVSLPKPIPILLSGGTSMAGGFVDTFKTLFEARRKKFPIEISEVRPVADPMNAVAHGLLVQALQEDE